MKLARIACAAVGALAVGVATLGSGASAAPQPVAPVPQASTPPPLTATATPAPAGNVVRYAGQLLDYRKGFVFFTTGDGFKAAPAMKVDDAKTGGTTALQPETRVYARASFDSASGQIVELGLSTSPLPPEAAYDQIKAFAIVASKPTANPELAPRDGYNGKPVLVEFTVTVPPKTPFGDTVYLSTDASGWSATAIKMDRIDALRYRVIREYPSGTKLLYRFTRGSTQTQERTIDGQEVTHALTVSNSDVLPIDVRVYNWADQNENQPDNGAAPGSIPTPFNPIPFITPPGVPRPH